MRALLIRRPWIDMILDGKKTWEIRGSRTWVRGQIRLIASRSGTVVGVCDLVDCIGPLTAEEFPQECEEGRNASERGDVGLLSADLRMGDGEATKTKAGGSIRTSVRGSHLGEARCDGRAKDPQATRGLVMNLSPITIRKETKAAFDALRSCLIAGAKKFNRNVGWPGDHGEFTLYWHEDAGFWVVFAGEEEVSRYWCAYGTMDPNSNTSVDITCEINPPTEGIDRRCAGIFLKDSGSGLYLAHSGKVGGGRKGIGKTKFLEQYSGSLEEIEWPDGVTAEVVLLGKIGGRAFINSVAVYLRAVEAFKADTTGQAPAAVTERNPDLSFTPEFEGPKRKYKLTAAIESQCHHGTVVNTLHAELKTFGLDAYKTSKIDLFLADPKGRITHLIEVKTDQTTTSLYQAVGQVMLHGALEKSDPRRILVLPGEVTSDTAKRMKRLGIEIIRYDWKGDKQAGLHGLEEGAIVSVQERVDDGGSDNNCQCSVETPQRSLRRFQRCATQEHHRQNGRRVRDDFYGNLCERAGVPFLTHGVGRFLGEYCLSGVGKTGWPPAQFARRKPGDRKCRESDMTLLPGSRSAPFWPEQVRQCIVFGGYPKGDFERKVGTSDQMTPSEKKSLFVIVFEMPFNVGLAIRHRSWASRQQARSGSPGAWLRRR